ncbi:response regulator [Dyadobacter sp. 50-39]|uniref:response regulator n=1 Tax=Dyadobacter sp. 50-39 TaxID=1895756 RepID=UPI0025C139C3|nr:response regulator [Dyadobacter sp. 50-39]
MLDENAEGSVPPFSHDTHSPLMGRQAIDFVDLVQNIPFPVAMFDENLRMMSASDRWIRAGKLEDQKWVGMHLREICDEGELWEERHRAAQQGVGVEGQEEEIWIPAFETYQFVNWQIRPWRRTDGTVGGTVISVQNVSEGVMTRKKLERALAEEEKAKRIKDEFLSNISHELRTPLNGILGFTRLAMDTQAHGLRAEYLKIVNNSASKLLTIINDLLDFSETEADSIILELRKIPLCELVRQTVDLTSLAIHGKGLEMLVRFHDQHPLWIFADAERVKQVLVILLENAAKFTHQGEIELGIKHLFPFEKAGKGKFRFSVRDTGIGINPAKMEEILQPFMQAEAPATKRYEGTGLGLAIAGNLLRMMNSKLEIASSPDTGSIFTFELELDFQATEVEAPIDLGFIKRIMIVDDNHSASSYIQEILHFHDITCDLVQSAAEAMDLLETGKVYDAMLIDHDLSEANGVPLTARLKEAALLSHPEVVLMHTSLAHLLPAVQSETVARSLIQKPVRYQDLIIALSNLYGKIHEERHEKQWATKLIRPRNAALSILMVEDNLVNMLLLKTILRKLFPDANLVEVGNGLAAVNICRQELPDIVFMDVQMPVMNGLDATKAIRDIEYAKALPIIALTAGNEKGAREKCLEAGMNEFLTKPYTKKDLIKVFEQFELV